MVGMAEFHAVTNCKKLMQHAISCAADTTFIPLSDSISDTIGALTSNPEYAGIPIDTLVVDLTNQLDGVDDISVNNSIS
jgi:hypothetical protein